MCCGEIDPSRFGSDSVLIYGMSTKQRGEVHQREVGTEAQINIHLIHTKQRFSALWP